MSKDEEKQSTDNQPWPQATNYDFSSIPREISSLPANRLSGDEDNFFRSAKWCSDGSAILTTAEDRTVRIIPTPGEERILGEIKHIPQPDAVLGAIWYPSASSLTPETYCFTVSVRDTPVRLVDATTGLVRASYPIVDHREQFVGPHSMAFNTSATKLYCGFQNAIEVFDVAMPGYDTSDRIKTSFNKKDPGAQRGIISALGFSYDYSGVYSAGSYDGTVSIYDEDINTPVLHLEGVEGGGVTQTTFHPLSSQILFVASRRSTAIEIFDLRNPLQPILSLPQMGNTNQRLNFDVDPWGRYLIAGDENGFVKVWDISQGGNEVTIFEEKLHDAPIPSTQLHPLFPRLLTISGTRRCPTSTFFSSSSTSTSATNSDSDSDSDSSTDSDSPESSHSIPDSRSDSDSESGSDSDSNHETKSKSKSNPTFHSISKADPLPSNPTLSTHSPTQSLNRLYQPSTTNDSLSKSPMMTNPDNGISSSDLLHGTSHTVDLRSDGEYGDKVVNARMEKGKRENVRLKIWSLDSQC
ncbi:hypothetical protein M231_03671 [Tremella mesenterica]|uniref:Uncharacterized protein n=1 Tax=Tremella mesenterica TaxID=5217 RepID=A0A4V1M441_TREME|nr:hypothetical protein M231_03671 [Tremella mesenterica]